jgi:hypothetical protein
MVFGEEPLLHRAIIRRPIIPPEDAGRTCLNPAKDRERVRAPRLPDGYLTKYASTVSATKPAVRMPGER